MEKAKHGEYDKFAHEHGAKFFPFIIESLGAFGRETAGVLKVLSKAVFNNKSIDAPREFLVHCNRVLSVAVQRGNALVVRRSSSDSRCCHCRSRGG